MKRRIETVDCLVALGIALSVGLIVLSAMVNFRVGFRRADTEFDAVIYGLGMAFGDGLKALCPFMIGWAWQHGRWGSSGAGALLFAVLTVASLQAGVEFASELRAQREGGRLSAGEKRAELKKELGDAEEALRVLGVQRGVGEIEAAVSVIWARRVDGGTVRSVSQECTLNRRVTREGCEEVAVLRQELARAQDWAERTRRVSELRTELAGLGSEGMGVVDPQGAAVGGVLGWTGLLSDQERVRVALMLVVGLVFELGSGLGLYVSMLPWSGHRSDVVQGQGVGRGEGGVAWDGEGSVARLGDIETYMLERVGMRERSAVTGEVVFGDYVRWCFERGEVALAVREFQRGFMDLAVEIGIGVEAVGGAVRYLDVALEDVGSGGDGVSRDAAGVRVGRK